MHPIDSEMHARMVMEERHREAARARRVPRGVWPDWRVDVGRVLIRAGSWLAGPRPTAHQL